MDTFEKWYTSEHPVSGGTTDAIKKEAAREGWRAALKQSIFTAIDPVSLQPGDTIVLRVATHLAERERERLAYFAKEQFGENKVIIIEGNMDMAVLRPSSNNTGE